MGQHIRESVVAAVVTAATGLTTVAANVFRQREYNFEATYLPSYNVLQGAEEPLTEEGGVYTYTDRVLAVTVELRARAVASVETTLNLIESELVAAVLADRRLGLGEAVVHEVKEGPTSEIEIEVIGDQPVAMVTKAFEISYRTDGTDPAT